MTIRQEYVLKAALVSCNTRKKQTNKHMEILSVYKVFKHQILTQDYCSQDQISTYYLLVIMIYVVLYFVLKYQLWLKCECHILQFLRHLQVIYENHAYIFCLLQIFNTGKRLRKMKYSPYVCMLFYEKESSSVNMLFVATSKFNFMMF